MNITTEQLYTFKPRKANWGRSREKAQRRFGVGQENELSGEYTKVDEDVGNVPGRYITIKCLSQGMSRVGTTEG